MVVAAPMPWSFFFNATTTDRSKVDILSYTSIWLEMCFLHTYFAVTCLSKLAWWHTKMWYGLVSPTQCECGPAIGWHSSACTFHVGKPAVAIAGHRLFGVDRFLEFRVLGFRVWGMGRCPRPWGCCTRVCVFFITSPEVMMMMSQNAW